MMKPLAWSVNPRNMCTSSNMNPDVDSLEFSSDAKLVLLSQTTLSVDETAGTIAALKERFPWLEMPPNSDICYATSNRQAAVKLVAEQSDCVVIVGSAIRRIPFV